MGLFNKTTPVVLPPNLSFAGQTILITGATSGLGLESAILYTTHGAKSVIITARTLEKGAAAQLAIEARTGKKSVISVRVLDMDTFKGVLSFVAQLKAEVTTGMFFSFPPSQIVLDVLC